MVEYDALIIMTGYCETGGSTLSYKVAWRVFSCHLPNYTMLALPGPMALYNGRPLGWLVLSLACEDELQLFGFHSSVGYNPLWTA